MHSLVIPQRFHEGICAKPGFILAKRALETGCLALTQQTASGTMSADRMYGTPGFLSRRALNALASVSAL